MTRWLILAALVVSPVQAGGSMSNAVKVVVVERPGKTEQLRKDFAKKHASEDKVADKAAKAGAKLKSAADKAYKKKWKKK